ncbi:MAG: InlB B-repeat-containing protein [Lachnospiraceae bacterium]|nr:InlB B-repeat-containing protein [Lachnospiraceae bacterium]
MKKILKRLVLATLLVVMFTLTFKSSTPIQAATPTVTITYNANGGVYNTGSKGAKQTVVKDANVILLPPSVERSGYIFLGYAQNNRASYPGYLLGSKQYKFSYNITLYAVWVKRAEIYDRYGDEFKFGVNKDQVKDTLTLFSASSWAGAHPLVKNVAVTTLAVQLTGMYGIKKMPSIVKGLPRGADPSTTMGGYVDANNTLYLNPKLYENGYLVSEDGKRTPACHELALTIAHELRHAYQHQRAKNPQGKTDYLYAYNFGELGYSRANYIAPIKNASGKYVNYNEYQDQLVEAEAFGIEELFKEFLK